MGSFGYIYGLRDPRGGPIRYVGKTTRPSQRLVEHIRDCKGRTYKDTWVRSLLREGVEPAMDLLLVCPLGRLDEEEKRHVAEYRLLVGEKLTNGTEGGTGGALLPEIARAAGEKRRGRPVTAERRAAVSATMKKRCEDPAERERLRSISTTPPPVRRGEDNNKATVTGDDVLEMRHLRSEGWDLQRLAERFNVTKTNVSFIVTGKTWAHIGGPIVDGKPKQRLSDDDVRDIRKRSMDGETNAAIAAVYGVDPSHVSKIITKRVRKNVS